MIEKTQISTLAKEYKLWRNKLDNYLTECIALKESIREIYNIDNDITTKLIPFESAVNNKIVHIKDLIAKIRIQEEEAHFIMVNRPKKVEYYRQQQEKLREEMKKLHKEHLGLLDDFFNEVIV
ncbi:MAG: hypothetical protein GVY19_02695 [Bacteroidetes bacterium]|jgi:hypothetical protein|nr:hypothetical protein [Bacteroidota bacterium]